jgi:hypothetical protein
VTINEDYKKKLNNLVKVRKGWKADYENALAEIIRDRETQWNELVEEACERVTLMTFDDLYFSASGKHINYLEEIQLAIAKGMAEDYQNKGEWF